MTASDPLHDFFVSGQEQAASGPDTLGRAAVASAASRLELLGFYVADEEYAFDIVDIQEIVKVPEVTEVPRSKTFLLGIVSLRGSIVPIIDLRRVLELPPSPEVVGRRILVLRGGGDPVGILVDRVSSVARIERDAVEPVPRAVQRRASELLKGVGRLGERMVILLDSEAVLRLLEAA